MYLVRITYHRYAGTISRDPGYSYIGRHGDYYGAPLESFSSREAARQWISANADLYTRLGNGEYRPPTFTAVPLHRVRADIREFAV